MKKILLVLLSVLCCFALLTACSGQTQSGSMSATPGDGEETVTPGGEETPGGDETPDGGNHPDTPHEHTYEDTLSYDETHHWHAASCGCEGERAKYAEHHFETETVKTPTCTEEGLQRMVCETCGYLKGEETLPAAHTLVTHEAKTPTCTEDGWEAYEACTRCDYSTRQPFKATHELTIMPGKEPTCTEGGWYKYERCKNCDHQVGYEAIAPLDHDRTSHPGQAATEERAGWEPYETCSRCDYSTYQEIPPLGHTHVLEQYAAKAPTCQAVGWEAYEACKNCSYTTYAALPLAAHDTVPHAGQPSTCTTPGWQDYVTCKNCSYTTYLALPAAGHKDGEWITDEKATCTTPGSQHRVCAVCAESIATATIPETGHKLATGWSYDEAQHYRVCLNNCGHQADLGNHEPDPTGLCYDCGYQGEMPGPYTIKEDGKILFGYYPQSDVTDAALIAALSMQAGSLPSIGNNGAWSLYDYETMLWYIDLTHNGRRYRGVYFTKASDDFSENEYEENGYEKNTVYWFRYDVLEWQVLKQEGSKALLICTSIIDAQEIQAGPTKYIANGKYGGYSIIASDKGYGKYISNYYYSTIRTWLNATFYETAFTAAQQALILTTTVDNSASSLYAGATPAYPDGTNASANTQDKIFLLSKKEICQYGFAYDNGTADPQRMRKPSEYAKAMGCPYYKASNHMTNNPDLVGFGSWWLRSPNYSPAMSSDVNFVSTDGTATKCVYASAIMGVVPVLYLQLAP